jgi:hypothetical protein
MTFSPQKLFARAKKCNGFALVLVLAFVVLLTGIALAFLSDSLLQRQVSNSSAGQVGASLLADGAVDVITGDLQSEIVAGSSPVAIPTGGVTTTLYPPRSSTGQSYALAPASPNPGVFSTMLPSTQGFSRPTPAPTVASPDPLANLVKVSSSGNPFYPGDAAHGNAAGPSRAAASPTNVGNRPITPARWNKALFLKATSTTDLTPATTGVPVPDWIYVANDGSNAMAATTDVRGRYAYAIYDEGGLLDANVAGYPASIPAASTNTLAPYTAKNGEAYADLTQIGLSQAQIDALVNWRNAATQNVTNGYQNYVAFNTSGFLKTSNTTFPGVSDRMFVSRLQLIDYLTGNLAPRNQQVQDALQYLTTFSRDLNQPSYIRLQSTTAGSTLDYNAAAPKVLGQTQGGNMEANTPVAGHDHDINPSFLGATVTGTFTRNDGTPAVTGEPLMKKRFALNRLAWITYKGPSADRASSSDPDIQALVDYGIPRTFLQQGTAQNIQTYFGLHWDGSIWTYVDNTGGPIKKFSQIAGSREPDFFEILKATINVGSLGKSLITGRGINIPSTAGPGNIENSTSQDQPYNYNWKLESSVDRQIIQIGANIISQFQPANYPPRIIFSDGANNRGLAPIVGVENLPYLFNVFSGILQVENPNLPKTCGAGAFMQLPVIWNPHDPDSPTKNPSGTLVPTPTVFRIVADSATPDEVAQNAAHKNFSVFGIGATVSYNADQTSPGNSSSSDNTWYRDSTGTGVYPHPIDQAHSAINFSLVASAPAGGSSTIFNEPTMLVRPGLIHDINQNQFRVTVDPSNLMATDPGVKSKFSGGGLLSAVSNPLGMAPDETGTYWGTNPACIGFFLGSFPLAWNKDKTATDSPNAATVSRADGTATGNSATCYLTYRIQYSDPSGNWVTYDTKYGKVTDAFTTFQNGQPGGLLCGHGTIRGNSGVDGWGGFYASMVDPRSNRFGLLWQDRTSGATANPRAWQANVSLPGPEYVYQWVSESASARGWIDPQNAILSSLRPDRLAGYYFGGYGTSMSDPRNHWPLTDSAARAAGWMVSAGTDHQVNQALVAGLLSENNTSIANDHLRYEGNQNGSGTFGANYFADPDGIVRRAMGGFVPSGIDSFGNIISSSGTDGLPLARGYTWKNIAPPPQASPYQKVYSTAAFTSGGPYQIQSRPYFLHRPFYSVAELGYVFTDTPWRDLDFFTAESGNAALLDAFCINDTDDANGLVAGKINLNTRQPKALLAILRNAYLDSALPGSGSAIGHLDLATATNLANALVYRTTDSADAKFGTGPMANVSELIGKWIGKGTIQSIPGTDPVTPAPLPSPFYDGKASYSGFSGGDWDSTNGKPKKTSPSRDVYSAYLNSGAFTSNSNKNGSQETVAYIERFREAPIRALANVGQTRIWNLMIDVIAQTGRIPSGTVSFNNFQITGEQRYWVHLAIDRYTGKVIDRKVEVVKE